MMEFSVVIPVYNSERSLEELIKRINATLSPLNAQFEIICVNDYSTDGSWKKLKELKKVYPDTLKIIALAKNFGQHSALFCGFTYATGNFILTIDDDLQHAPEDLSVLIAEARKGNFEVVYGMSKEMKSNTRKFYSWIWNYLTRKIDDGIGKGSAFRILNGRVKDAVVKHSQGVIFIDEIIQWHTHAIGYIDVSHYPRRYGTSNYDGLRIFNFITKVSFSYSTVPLRLMSLLGGMISIFTFLLGVWFIVKKVFFGIAVPGFTGLIVAILFSSSLMLIGLGLLGRYLNQIFILLNNKPSFSVDEEVL